MRGRKPAQIWTITLITIAIKKESPNEGTETAITDRNNEIKDLIKKESPNEGTETGISVPA